MKFSFRFQICGWIFMKMNFDFQFAAGNLKK
jgi:hypothetical protein